MSKLTAEREAEIRATVNDGWRGYDAELAVEDLLAALDAERAEVERLRKELRAKVAFETPVMRESKRGFDMAHAHILERQKLTKERDQARRDAVELHEGLALETGRESADDTTRQGKRIAAYRKALPDA